MPVIKIADWNTPGISIKVVVDTSEFGSALPTGGPQMEMKSGRAFLATVLSTVRYPLILVDREGRIEAVSHAAADLLAVSPDAA